MQLIREADPLLLPVVIIILTHVVIPYVVFKISQNKTTFK